MTLTPEAKQESDTPLSRLISQGSSLTSYVIGQIADLERQLAQVTAERDALRVDAKRYTAIRRMSQQNYGEQARLQAAMSSVVPEDSNVELTPEIFDASIDALRAAIDAARGARVVS